MVKKFLLGKYNIQSDKQIKTDILNLYLSYSGLHFILKIFYDIVLFTFDKLLIFLM